MPGACATCAFYRRARLPSHLFAALFDATSEGAEIAQAIGKIAEDEHKLREVEAETKGREGQASRDAWGARPVTSDFCGREEQNEIFRIAEVKNSGYQCKDHEPEPAPRHACADCAHRVPAAGRTNDLRMETVYTSLVASSIAAGGSPQTSEGLLQGYRAGETAQKAFEISAAYESKGRLVTKPKYLDHCGKFSDLDDYVVCVLRNPHHSCGSWEDAKPKEGS